MSKPRARKRARHRAMLHAFAAEAMRAGWRLAELDPRQGLVLVHRATGRRVAADLPVAAHDAAETAHQLRVLAERLATP